MQQCQQDARFNLVCPGAPATAIALNLLCASFGGASSSVVYEIARLPAAEKEVQRVIDH
jgi:hypothetical protein